LIYMVTLMKNDKENSTIVSLDSGRHHWEMVINDDESVTVFWRDREQELGGYKEWTLKPLPKCKTCKDEKKVWAYRLDCEECHGRGGEYKYDDSYQCLWYYCDSCGHYEPCPSCNAGNAQQIPGV
jgi:hypothetical protein